MIVSCPQRENAVAVSTTINPVTQTAEVEVKRASRKESPSSLDDVKGIIRIRVPARMTSRKLRTIVWAGFRLMDMTMAFSFLKRVRILSTRKVFLRMTAERSDDAAAGASRDRMVRYFV